MLDGKQEQDCPAYSELSARMESLSDSKDAQIQIMHQDMALMRGEIHSLRSDMRVLTASTKGIEESLRVIAESMRHMSDFPSVWVKIKGFWAVMSWLRTNMLTLLFIAALAALIISESGHSVLKGLQ